MLEPKAEVSIFPWKEPKERIPLAVAPDTFLPPGTPPCFCLDGGVHATRVAGASSATLLSLQIH